MLRLSLRLWMIRLTLGPRRATACCGQTTPAMLEREASRGRLTLADRSPEEQLVPLPRPVRSISTVTPAAKGQGRLALSPLPLRRFPGRLTLT